MTGSVLLDTADTLTAAINAAQEAGAFSRPFEAVRAYIPPVPFDKLEGKGLQVIVGPMELDIEEQTRDSKLWKPGIGVAVIQWVKAPTKDEVDPLVLLVEALQRTAQTVLRVGTSQAGWIQTANKPIYRPDFLMSGVFWSVSTFTYQLVR